MKSEIIVNQTAGGGKPKQIMPQIISYFNQREFQFHISYTSANKGATLLARKAANQGVDLVVSVGGDGTINEIVNGLLTAKHQPILGIIPAGWANDFIKSIPIPNQVESACEIIGRGKTMPIDVGLINNSIYFVNVFGIGLDAEIAKRANQMKSDHPKWKTLSAYVYVFAALQKLLQSLPCYKTKMTIDQTKVNENLLILAIANGKIEGGKFNIAPEAKINDGLLDICLIKKLSKWRCLKFLPKAMNGTHKKVPEVCFYHGRQITIEIDRPVSAQVAGEIIPAQKIYQIKLLPHQLNIIVP